MTTIGSLFAVAYGNKFDQNKMEMAAKEQGIAFVGRRGGLHGHSGVSGYVESIDGVKPYEPGLLTVALGGSRLLSTYVQQRAFYTAQNVAVLTPKDSDMSLNCRLYYAACIRHNAFRYTAFGREANRSIATIKLPDQVPDWVETTKLPTIAGLSKAAGRRRALTSPESDIWAEFRLDSLFDIRKGKRVTKADRLPGATRFVGASENNNGITDHSDLDPIFDAGTTTVVYNGNSVGYAFYQDQPYFACDDVNVLVPRVEMSKWVQLFIAAVLRHGRSRYTYGYKWTLARMQETTVRLPTKNGDPDWAYMETFMRGLPYSAAVS